MNQTSIARSIQHYLKDLGKEQQEKVLEFTKALCSQQIIGVHGSALIDVACGISPEDLAVMRKVIETNCEQVNSDDW